MQKHTLFSALLLASVLSCASLQAQTAVTNAPVAAAPRTNDAIIPAERTGKVHDRYLELNERVKGVKGQVDLVFIGDSITQGWEGNGKEVWAKYYGHRKALNSGIGGDRTQHVLWRLDHGNVDGIDPKVAVLMIGTNNSNDTGNTPEEITSGIVAVVEKIKVKLPNAKILLLGIFPRGDKFNTQRGRITQVNQAIQKLADDKQVYFLDIGHRFINLDGTISKELMPDYLHLVPAGYQIWADAIEEKLSSLLGDKPVQK